MTFAVKIKDGKVLKGAVIGYGFISGKGHIPSYLDRARKSGDVKIVAVADICEERRKLAAKALPEAKIYSDYQSLLKAESAVLDFVDISTPPCDHAKIAKAAMDAGLHVLCEKPLTTTLEEARDLLNHAVQSKRVLFPAHNYKHAPVVKTIREIIQSGKIGEVRNVALSTYRNTHAKGVTEWNTNWRRDFKYSGGGIAMDHGSHSFYLTFEWLGAYPTAITAKMTNQEPQKYDTEDNFSTVVTFPTGLANCNLTWTAGVRKVIYAIQGTKGAITVDDDDMQVAIQEKTDGPDVAQGAIRWNVEKTMISSDWMDASHVTWFNALFDQFKTAIETDDYAGKEAKEAYRCVEMITKAYESARNGCKEEKLLGI
ncbi:MAG: Gfo/Idh/MocA family oxidoreductase [Bdellovibrionales bacterium]|nr:Gfo/Idh/MocA family oxidoreductase [Bdellovibrionales bacterium]